MVHMRPVRWNSKMSDRFKPAQPCQESLTCKTYHQAGHLIHILGREVEVEGEDADLLRGGVPRLVERGVSCWHG